MLTQAAQRTLAAQPPYGLGVHTRAELLAMGNTRSAIRARIDARRWQVVGRAIVFGNADLTREQRWRVAVLNCGPRAVLAAFSAAEHRGLTGWEREAVHVLAPAGAARPGIELPIVLHRSRHVGDAGSALASCQAIEPALALCAASTTRPRAACGVLVAGVQQRLTTVDRLRRAVLAEPNSRHRPLLLSTLDDVEMGAQALSEIDFARLCRSAGLPTPRRQAVRIEPDGRRRYLDVEWLLTTGRRLVVEVDGAVHLAVERWYDDQLRQNEIVIDGASVLRYASVIVRAEPALVVDQLRRAMGADARDAVMLSARHGARRG